MFQFGSPGAQFDYTSGSSSWCYHNDIENGTFNGEKSQSASSVDQYPFVDGDQMLSWSGSTTPSNHMFFSCESTTPLSNTSTEAGVLKVGNSQNTHSNIHRDVPLSGGNETMNVNMGTSVSEMKPSTDLSQEDSYTSCREPTQSGNVRSSFCPS